MSYLIGFVVSRSRELLGREQGGSYMEWVLTAALIAMFAVLALKFLGTENSAMWDDVSTSFLE